MALLCPFGYDSIASIHTVTQAVTKLPYVLLYVGPDQLLPLTSVFGAIVGVALMFWRRVVSFARVVWALVRRRPPQPRDGRVGSPLD